MSEVLVTGGSGFIAAHCILQLLATGHRVRTTVRNLARRDEVLAMLKQGGAAAPADVAFHAADLTVDAGWAEAVKGCDHVLHVASPLVPYVPRDENELVVPAREGTLRVLRAARDAGVKRLVLTSSFAAIGYGHPSRETPFDETVWTNIEGDDVQPYVKSKALAERAAWDFIAREGGALELAVVNPVAVLGPALGPDVSASLTLVQALLDGRTPGSPADQFRIGRCARCRRFAPAGDGAPGGQGRAVPGGGGRADVDDRDRPGAAAASGRHRPAGAAAADAGLVGACAGLGGAADARCAADARSPSSRQRRQGAAPARLEGAPQ